MREKTVKRFYCDHCNNGGFMRSTMAQHEARCARNPDRVCGYCKDAGLAQASIDELIHGLREHGLDKLRDAANGCPACMLSAILQDRERHPDEPREWIAGFDYKEESLAFLREIDDTRSFNGARG